MIFGKNCESMDEQTYSGTFFRDLFHELNDPLAAVSGGLEAWESLDNERRDRLQPALLRNAQIMKKMLRDVGRYLALAQAGADEASSFTLSECVERSLEECEAAFESRRHQVETEVPSIRLTTKTGEENFRLLITSMLLTLSRSCPAEKTIRLSFRVENESSLLISSQAEYRGARLVQSDFRLTVLKELVEREGATLITTTDPIPRLEIALNCRVEASELEEEENGSATVSRHRVLVVDDNRDGAETLSLWLTAQGYETQVAFEGDEAEEKFDRWSPDVIILDIGLPGRSGYELAQDFRSRGYQGLYLIHI